MKYITLDFTGCKYLGEIHQVLKNRLEFPDYYGENLSALWDCLRYYSNEEMCIYIRGLSSLPTEFDDYMKKVLEIFQRVTSESPNITFEVLS